MKRRTRFLAIPLACLLSGCAASTSEHVNAEVERLEHEVLELRRQFALESATQMRQIGIYAALYAQSGADRFPEKPSELRALLDLRSEVERSSNCPHGRPTTIRLTDSLNENGPGRMRDPGRILQPRRAWRYSSPRISSPSIPSPGTSSPGSPRGRISSS